MAADSILVPPLFYLETSAVRNLFEEAAQVPLRQRVEQLSREGRLLLCTSVRTIEELVTTIPPGAQLLACLHWLRDVTPRRLISRDKATVVRRWVRHALDPTAARETILGHWMPDLSVVPAKRAELEKWRDQSKAKHQAMLDHYVGIFKQPGFPPHLGMKPEHWSNAAHLYEQARALAQGYYDKPAKYVELLAPHVPVGSEGFTEIDLWECRRNPWVQLWLGHVFSGVVKQVLRGTPDHKLENEFYDGEHIVFGSVADALVTDDYRLAEAIEHLRVGDTPRVFRLRDLSSELDRCT